MHKNILVSQNTKIYKTYVPSPKSQKYVSQSPENRCLNSHGVPTTVFVVALLFLSAVHPSIHKQSSVLKASDSAVCAVPIQIQSGAVAAVIVEKKDDESGKSVPG